MLTTAANVSIMDMNAVHFVFVLFSLICEYFKGHFEERNVALAFGSVWNLKDSNRWFVVTCSCAS